MEDRELLELAAKAVGIELVFSSITGTPRRLPEYECWNPITDDGDALRLAVKLNMTLAVGVARSDAGEFIEFDLFESDPFAATRRAIVRAAAEVGKAMK